MKDSIVRECSIHTKVSVEANRILKYWGFDYNLTMAQVIEAAAQALVRARGRKVPLWMSTPSCTMVPVGPLTPAGQYSELPLLEPKHEGEEFKGSSDSREGVVIPPEKEDWGSILEGMQDDK